MKYLKYSQILYLFAGLAFLGSAINKFSTNQDYGLQVIIGVGFIIMHFVRKYFLNKMNNQNKNL
jgi:hypothetical protein